VRRSLILLACGLGAALFVEIDSACAARAPAEVRVHHRYAFLPRRTLVLRSSAAHIVPDASLKKRLVVFDAPRPIDRTDPWTGETIAEDPAIGGLHHRIVVRVPRPIDTDDPWSLVKDNTVVNDSDDRIIASITD
jgi:hypothetical protein